MLFCCCCVVICCCWFLLAAAILAAAVLAAKVVEICGVGTLHKVVDHCSVLMSKVVALEFHLANISELANILLLVALEVHLVLRQTNQHWRLIFITYQNLQTNL